MYNNTLAVFLEYFLREGGKKEILGCKGAEGDRYHSVNTFENGVSLL